MAIKVTGGGKWQKTIQAIADQAATAHIGVLEGATYDGGRGTKAGQSVAQVAAAMEFGTDTVPVRKPMQNTADLYGDKWAQGIVTLTKSRSTQPNAFVNAVDIVSEKAVKDMQMQIEGKNPPPLEESTKENKKRKGRSNPEQTLIDTGTFQRSIDKEMFVKGRKR